MTKKVKEANDVIEVARNEEAVRRNGENTNRRSGDWRSKGPGPGKTHKQFKPPTGVLPRRFFETSLPFLLKSGPLI